LKKKIEEKYSRGFGFLKVGGWLRHRKI